MSKNTMFKFKSSISNTFQLTYELQPSDATVQTVLWSSEDPSIAQVDSDGVVTAVSEGTCNINITTMDGNFTDYCEVIVNKYIPDITITPTTIETTMDNCSQIVVDAPNGSVITWSLSNISQILTDSTIQLIVSSDSKTCDIKTLNSNDLVVNKEIFITVDGSVNIVPITINKILPTLYYTQQKPEPNSTNTNIPVETERAFESMLLNWNPTRNNTTPHFYRIGSKQLDELEIPYTISFDSPTYVMPEPIGADVTSQGLMDGTVSGSTYSVKFVPYNGEILTNDAIFTLTGNIEFTNNCGTINKIPFKIQDKTIVDYINYQEYEDSIPVSLEFNSLTMRSLENEIMSYSLYNDVTIWPFMAKFPDYLDLFVFDYKEGQVPVYTIDGNYLLINPYAETDIAYKDLYTVTVTYCRFTKTGELLTSEAFMNIVPPPLSPGGPGGLTIN